MSTILSPSLRSNIVCQLNCKNSPQQFLLLALVFYFFVCFSHSLIRSWRTSSSVCESELMASLYFGWELSHTSVFASFQPVLLYVLEWRKKNKNNSLVTVRLQIMPHHWLGVLEVNLMENWYFVAWMKEWFSTKKMCQSCSLHLLFKPANGRDT